jgi:transposase
MGKTLYKVTLTNEERQQLISLTKNGKHSSRKVIHALILLNSDKGAFCEPSHRTNKEVAEFLSVSQTMVERIKRRFVEDGIDYALEDKPSEREYTRKIDGDLEARLIALSCSEAPEGFSRWSLQLLADKAVELEYVESITHETVRQVLKKTNLSRGRKKAGLFLHCKTVILWQIWKKCLKFTNAHITTNAQLSVWMNRPSSLLVRQNYPFRQNPDKNRGLIMTMFARVSALFL